MDGTWVPIVMFIGLFASIIVGFWMSYRHKANVQLTVRTALDQGQPLTPELLDRLGESRKSKNADLRKGVIYIAVAVGIALFGMLVGEDDAEGPMLAIACVPGFIGLAYLLLWKLDPQEDDTASDNRATSNL